MTETVILCLNFNFQRFIFRLQFLDNAAWNLIPTWNKYDDKFVITNAIKSTDGLINKQQIVSRFVLSQN